MQTMTVLIDRAADHRMSRAEFEALRDAADERLRYELLDGELLVTPAPSFVVAPLVPSLTVYRLGDAGYAEVAHVTGDEQVELTEPVTIRLRPSELVQPTRP